MVQPNFNPWERPIHLIRNEVGLLHFYRLQERLSLSSQRVSQLERQLKDLEERRDDRTIVAVDANDGVVVDILFRELANTRELLHNSFDDNEAYADLVEKFKQKTSSSASKAEQSSAYLETLSQFNDGLISGKSADSGLQVKNRSWRHLATVLKEKMKTHTQSKPNLFYTWVLRFYILYLSPLQLYLFSKY